MKNLLHKQEAFPQNWGFCGGEICGVLDKYK